MPPRLPALLDTPIAFAHAYPTPVDRSDLDDGGRGDPGGDAATGTSDTAAERLWLTAAALGADGLATDVWLTADRVPVVSRTRRIGGRFRRRSLDTVMSNDLGLAPTRAIAGLDELYRATGPDRPLSLDLHDAAALEPVLAIARAAGDHAEANLWLCHPDLATLTSWRSRTSARLVNTTGYRKLDGGLERRAAELERRGIDGLRLEHRDWTGGRVTLLHRFGRLALGTGAVHPREHAALIDAGIDAAYSESVASLVAVMGQFYASS